MVGENRNLKLDALNVERWTFLKYRYPQMPQMTGMVECWVDWKWEIPFVFFVFFVAKK